MLRPANVVDLPLLRALIRDGAMMGSVDRELATDSRKSSLFFSNLRQALATGYLIEEDPVTGDMVTVAVPGYVYQPDGIGADKPIGFGIFKAAPVGYELWLTGLAVEWRGHGHGRAMLNGLLKTAPGKETYVVRLNADAKEATAMGHLLITFDYKPARKVGENMWYLRNDTPDNIRHRLMVPPTPGTPH